MGSNPILSADTGTSGVGPQNLLHLGLDGCSGEEVGAAGGEVRGTGFSNVILTDPVGIVTMQSR